MTPETTLGLALSLPALGALLALAAGSRPNLRETVTLVATLSTFAATVALLPEVMSGGRPQLELLEVFPGVALAFEVEPLGMLFALVASGLWIVTSL